MQMLGRFQGAASGELSFQHGRHAEEPEPQRSWVLRGLEGFFSVFIGFFKEFLGVYRGLWWFIGVYRGFTVVFRGARRVFWCFLGVYRGLWGLGLRNFSWVLVKGSNLSYHNRDL